MDDVPTFAVILVAGITVFGLFYVAENADLGTSTGETREKIVLSQHSFGKVGDANQDSRSVRLGTFSVGEARGRIDVYSRDRVEVTSGLLSSDSIGFTYNATQPGAGTATFEVLGRDGSGAVYVDVNGERVYEEKLLSTSTPAVTIPRQALETGVNHISIGTTSGGWFGSTSYVLEDLEVKVSDRKFHDYSESFQMYGYELQDLVGARLTFSIRSSVKNEPLEILVNGREIYSKRQVRAQETISIDPGEAGLHPGVNRVQFRTDGESVYRIENAEFTVRYLGTVERKDLRLEFDMNSTEAAFVNREDTREKSSFDYRRLMPSAETMILKLNNRTKELIPSNGDNAWVLKEGALEEGNVLRVSSNTTYKLDDLKVVSRKVE